jgi:periplasmic protein TonB
MAEQALLGRQTIFADSLLETSCNQRARRSWTTLTSFGLQAAIISLLLAIPLLRTVSLPSARTVSTPISIGRPDAELAPVRRSGSAAVAPGNNVIARFVRSGRMDANASRAGGDISQSSGGGEEPPVIGLGSSADGLPVNIIGRRPVLPSAPPPPIVHPFRKSSMLEGSLISRVQPVYPPLARAARIQGEVLLAATISKAGTIENLQVLSGHPMLVKAALDAVSQWRYRPYILNNEPVEVETQIMVNFTLGN